MRTEFNEPRAGPSTRSMGRPSQRWMGNGGDEPIPRSTSTATGISAAGRGRRDDRGPARAALPATRRIGFEVRPTDAARMDRPGGDSTRLVGWRSPRVAWLRLADSVYHAAG